MPDLQRASFGAMIQPLRGRLLLLSGALLLAFCGTTVYAQIQSTGTITGHVTDSSGAAVAKATVQITETETGVVTATATNSAGFYSENLLKPGVYSVKVIASGFKAEVRPNLTLQVAQVLAEDIQLQVGDVSQTVTVTGGTPLLNTETTDLGDVISRDPLIQLPLNGRNFSQLALLVPGTNGGEVGGTRASGNGNETQRAGANVVADGARATFNTYLIDGLNDNDQLIGTIKVFPDLEDIQEFKVQIGNYDAEYMSGGAVIKIPPFRQNQFGASIGGPIRKNKMFFFGDYQGLRIGEAFSNIISEPTPALRSGDFSAYPATIYDPTTYNAGTNSRQAFTGNVIPPGELKSVAKNLLAVIPLPNLPGEVNNLRVNDGESEVQNQFDIRIDNTISSKDSMFGRYTYGTATLSYPGVPLTVSGALNPLAFAQPSGNSLRNNSDPSQQATIQEVHVFSPTFSN